MTRQAYSPISGLIKAFGGKGFRRSGVVVCGGVCIKWAVGLENPGMPCCCVLGGVRVCAATEMGLGVG